MNVVAVFDLAALLLCIGILARLWFIRKRIK